MITGDAVIADGKAAGGNVGERNTESVEEGHFAIGPDEKKELEKGEEEVEFPELRGRLSDTGGDFIFDGASHFHLIEELAANTESWEHGEEDHDNSHASDPLEEAAPKEESFSDGFDSRILNEICLWIADRFHGAPVGVGFIWDMGIGDMDGDFFAGIWIVRFGADEGGAGGGKSRHRLKIGIEWIGESAAKIKWQRANERGDKPNENDEENSLAAIELPNALAPKGAENESCNERDQEGNKKGRGAVRLGMEIRIGEKFVIKG